MYRIYFSWSTWSTIKFHWPSFNETLSPRFLRDCRPRLTSICEVAVADRSTNGIRRRVLNVAATENDVFDGFCSWFAECLTVFRRKWIKSYPYKQRILAHCSPTTSPSSSSVPLPLVYQYWSQEDRGGREGRREREGRGGGGEEKGKEGGGGAKGRGRKRESKVQRQPSSISPPTPPPTLFVLPSFTGLSLLLSGRTVEALSSTQSTASVLISLPSFARFLTPSAYVLPCHLNRILPHFT